MRPLIPLSHQIVKVTTVEMLRESKKITNEVKIRNVKVIPSVFSPSPGPLILREREKNFCIFEILS